MGRRHKARADAAFERGELGVDGQAAEEKKDKEVVERDKAREELLRGGTSLGRELLTWLLWRSESTEAVARLDGDDVEVLFADRLLLRGVHGEVTEVLVKGTVAPYSELVRIALDRGLLVHSARVRLTLGEKQFEATLDAEHLDVRSAVLPSLLSEEEDDRLTERLDLVERLSRAIDALVRAFMAERTSKRWSKEVVPALKAWMREPARTAPMLRVAQGARRSAR